MATASIASRLNTFRDGCDFAFVQRFQHFAAGKHALIHFIAMHARDQRLMFGEVEIVGIRPVDAADFIDVAEILW